MMSIILPISSVNWKNKCAWLRITKKGIESKNINKKSLIDIVDVDLVGDHPC